MARPIVVMAFLTVGFGKFIVFVKKSATNPTDNVKATFRIFGIDEIRPAFEVSLNFQGRMDLTLEMRSEDH